MDFAANLFFSWAVSPGVRKATILATSGTRSSRSQELERTSIHPAANGSDMVASRCGFRRPVKQDVYL